VLLLAWAFVGGVAGAGVRVLITLRALGSLTSSMRFGALAADLAGSTAVGAAMHLAIRAAGHPGEGLAVAAGLLGGFTTAATFNEKRVERFRRTAWWRGALEMLGMASACLAGGMLGLLGARWLSEPPRPAPPASVAGGVSGRPGLPLASTFSIVAFDPHTGELGVAVQSHWFSVGSLVPWAEHGVGAVATQSFVEVSYGPEGLRLLRAGRSPEEALRQLTGADAQREFRQVGIVDARGRAASWTGKDCITFAGHSTGKNYAVQGNLLDSEAVWQAMGPAFEKARGSLAERMLAALDAAQAAGGDARGMQSAALLVVGAGEPGKPWTQRKIDLRVEDHSSPLAEIRRLLKLERAYDLADEGDRHVSEKKFEDAYRAYDQALALDPDNDELIFWRASMHMQAGKTELAVADVRRALALNPRWRKLLKRLPPEVFPGAAEILKRLDE
jgi:uncharacterized Ntn-hydrolase superfamily protein/fluoride ion exporter CrcB/FEX